MRTSESLSLAMPLTLRCGRDVLLACSTIIELRHLVSLLAGRAEVQLADPCSLP